MPLVGNLPHDLVGLDGRKSSSKLSASSKRKERVYGIDIKWYMELFIANWVKISNRLLQDFSNT